MCTRVRSSPASRGPDRPRALAHRPPAPGPAGCGAELPSLSPPAVRRHRPQHGPCAGHPGPARELHSREPHAASPGPGPPVGASGPPLLSHQPFQPRPRAQGDAPPPRGSQVSWGPPDLCLMPPGTRGLLRSRARKGPSGSRKTPNKAPGLFTLTAVSLAACHFPAKLCLRRRPSGPRSESARSGGVRNLLCRE